MYKIHPAIGIARVGNSDEYYIAPETAGGLPILPDGRPFSASDFRDADKRLRRQGVRFEVHRYDESREDAGAVVRPGEQGVARIEWTVHVANKKAIWYQFVVTAGEWGYAPDHPLRNAQVSDPKARAQLIIDPGPRTLREPNQQVEFSRHENPEDYPVTFPPEGLQPSSVDTLGGMRTDDQGRLIVVGGHGCSGTTEAIPAIVDYANNDAWWDDVSDGPVTARVVMEDGTAVEVEGSAWIIVAPPRYAPQLVNLVTLYDTIFDTAVRYMDARPDIISNQLWNPDYRPSWERDIRPILERAHRYQWVVAAPPRPHGFDFGKLGDPRPEFNGLRQYYLKLLRPPESPNYFASPDTGLPMMPFLCGDNCFQAGPVVADYLTVSPTQYFFLKQWAQGNFTADEAAEEPRGATLDRAALENCVGGAFSPGIEMTWMSRHAEIYAEPFRIRRKLHVEPPLSLGEDLAQGLEPGDLSKYMALPWQADFNECSQQPVGDRFVWWWPVQRPDYVYVARNGRLRQVPWVGQDDDQSADDYVQFADDLDMVKLWDQLGFVFNEGTEDAPRFVEVERLMNRSGGSDPDSG